MSVVETEIINYAPLEHSAALNLNPRQISFIEHYLECRVAWKAAELAGYSGNRNTLNAIASENLNKPIIQAYYLERLKALQVCPDETLAEIGQIARSPWKDHVEVQYGENGEVLHAKLKLQDKLKALELAGKYHKLWDRTDSELSLNPADMETLSNSVIQGILEAAQRKRAEQQAQLAATNPPPHSVE